MANYCVCEWYMASVTQEITIMRRNAASTKSRMRRTPAYAVAIEKGETSHGRAQASLPGYLAIRPSSIPNAGRGVFAQRNFQEGQPILMPTGRFVDAQTQTHAQHLYSFMVPDHPQVSFQCHLDSETNIVKYINSAHRTRRAPNAAILWHGTLPMVYATRPIRRGNEILFDYAF